MNTILLHAGIAQHNGDWNWKNVRSPFARIYYVVEGNAEIVFNDHKSLLHPGFLYIVPPFTTHSNRCDGLSHIITPISMSRRTRKTDCLRIMLSLTR